MAQLKVGRDVGRPRTRPDSIRGDKAYSSRAIRGHLRSRGIKAVIPEPADQKGHRRRRSSHGGRPVALDAASKEWPIDAADAIVCINMVHISPWEATQGLFAGAARLLPPHDGPLVLYGPYLEEDVETAPSNLAFDESLKARDPRWGLRRLADVDALGARNGLRRTRRVAMPANNLMLVYRRN